MSSTSPRTNFANPFSMLSGEQSIRSGVLEAPVVANWRFRSETAASTSEGESCLVAINLFNKFCGRPWPAHSHCENRGNRFTACPLYKVSLEIAVHQREAPDSLLR